MQPSNEIVLQVDAGFEVNAKGDATALSSLPSSLFWGGSTGSSGSETQKWAATSQTVSSGQIHTGAYQTYTPTSYNYYVANQTFTVGTSATMTVAGNTVDIISGHTAASNSTTPSITLGHIFARTGTLTMNTQEGYTISGISWTIVGKGDLQGTAGTYNMTSDSWTSASAKLTTATAITGSSDKYLIPGTYTVACTYTLTKGDYTHTFTKSADVTLVQGKINHITGTASGGNAQEIVLTVTLTDWGTTTLTPTFS